MGELDAKVLSMGGMDGMEKKSQVLMKLDGPVFVGAPVLKLKGSGGIKNIEAQLSTATTLQQNIDKLGGLAAVQDKLVDFDNLALCKMWSFAPTLDKIKENYDQHVSILTVISKTAIGQAKVKEERVDAYKDVEVDVRYHLTHYEPDYLVMSSQW